MYVCLASIWYFIKLFICVRGPVIFFWNLCWLLIPGYAGLIRWVGKMFLLSPVSERVSVRLVLFFSLVLDKICQWNNLSRGGFFCGDICDTQILLLLFLISLWGCSESHAVLCQFLITVFSKAFNSFPLNWIYWCKVGDNIPFPLMS